MTHVLLPVVVLLRRVDLAEVIGQALAAKATGLGARAIAERLGRPVDTVRGWLRRFAVRAEWVRAAFVALVCALDVDPRLPGPAGSVVGDAVAAVVAAAAAIGRRWTALGTAAGFGIGVSPWRVAAAVTAGGLLAPASTVRLTNTSCLW